MLSGGFFVNFWKMSFIYYIRHAELTRFSRLMQGKKARHKVFHPPVNLSEATLNIYYFFPCSEKGVLEGSWQMSEVDS